MSIWETVAAPILHIIDKVIPDPAQKAAAQLEVMKLQGSQEIDEMKASLSAIITEESSADPWTSRARPSFLYVMYIMILIAVPVGVLSCFSPDKAVAFQHGMNGYLAAIPDALYGLFGTGYLGYVAARQYGKTKGTDK